MSLFDLAQFLPAKPKVVNEDSLRGTYEVEGLYPGYGHTLGNSLRRIILSSMPGTAITAVKIEGVDHEFSTLAGVKEDVILILLALKKVRFVFGGDEPQTAKLRAKGVKVVTAGDIEVGSQVSILNPELPIATLVDKNALLNIEMTIEKGLGYASREILRGDRSDVGAIILDAVFTPIRRVSYEVENMRVGDRTDYNRLRMNIETDGTTTPREAFIRAVELMIAQLKALQDFSDKVDEKDKEVVPVKLEKSIRVEAKKGEALGDDLKTRIEDLGLSKRVARVLSVAGVRTLGGLVRKKEEDLLSVSGLGEKGLEEIKKVLGMKL